MSEATYSNFDLKIEPWESGYRAHVVASPVDGSATSRFSFLEEELDPSCWGDSAKLRAFGQRLFGRVFDDNVRDQLQRSRREAFHQAAEGVRIRLLLDKVPELAGLPWEYLYDPAADLFFCLSNETPVVRYLDLPAIHPLPVELPLRVLVMISSPIDQLPLDVEHEWGRLHQALSPLTAGGTIVLERIEEAMLSTLQRLLRQGQYHVFHFIGHGSFDEQAQDGMLLFEGQDGLSDPVSSRRLGVLLRDERTLRLAILNACEGARAVRTDPFAGVAQGLLRRGIPAVIAMQDAISDQAASTFAAEFYAALADGYAVDAALTEARKAIYLAGNEVEWGTPVFYMRLPDGRVFDLPRPEQAPTEPPVEEPVHEEEAEPRRVAAPGGGYTRRARPAQGGDSISNYRAGAATLGCLVVDRDNPDRIYILCDSSGIWLPSARDGDPILQPGIADQGSAVTDVIAVLSRRAEVRDDPGKAAANISAAIAQVHRLEDVSPQIRERGFLKGVRAASPGMPVFAVGRTSGLVQGAVLRLDGREQMGWPQNQVTGKLRSSGDGSGFVPILFADCIECSPMLQPGDSGVILLDAENYALGLGFAGDQARSLFIPIQKVLDALNVDLVTEEVWRSLTAPPQDRGAAMGGAALGEAALRHYERELRDLREQAERGRLVLFIGADLPESVTGLPSRQALADALAGREGVAPGRSLAEVAQAVMSGGNRWAFTNFLREHLDTVGKLPQPFHRAVVEVAQRYRLETLVTTAYDDLLESAFEQASARLHVVDTDSELQFIPPDQPSLIALYGRVARLDSLIVTEQDQNALLRGRIKRDLVDEVRSAFRRNSILFLGHDLGDPAVSALYDELAGSRFQIRSYAAWSGLSQREQESFRSNRNLGILDVDPVALLHAL